MFCLRFVFFCSFHLIEINLLINLFIPGNFFSFRRTNKMAKVFPYNHELTDKNSNSVATNNNPPPIIILDEIEENANEKTQTIKPGNFNFYKNKF